MGIFLPEQAAMAGTAAPPRLSSAVPEGSVLDLDFLALLEQEVTLAAAHLPGPQQPPRQILPASGQPLPPPLPLTTLLLKPAQRELTNQLPGPSVLSPNPVTTVPRGAADAPSVDVVPSAPEKVLRELPTVAQTPPRLVPIAVEAPPFVAVLAPHLASPTARAEIPPIVQRLAKPPAVAELTRRGSSKLDVAASGADVAQGRPGEPRAEFKLPLTPTLERFDFTQPVRSDSTSPLPVSSPPPTALPIISAPSMPTAEAFAAAPLNQAQTIPALLPDNLVDAVRTLSDQKGGEMRLRLNPPELGHLEIKVSVTEEQTFVSITANNSAARDVLEQHLGRLRTLLDSAGLNLTDAQVSSHGHSHQSQGDSLPEWATEAAHSIPADEPSDDPVVDPAGSPHGVDVFA